MLIARCRSLCVAVLALCCAVGLTARAQEQTPEPARPNIVVIYVDDLGYGDVGVNGGLAATPHIDALAANGLNFTDGHAPASTCTPSRYALLTGQYAFRRDGTGIARGDATAIIPAGTPTVASMLRAHGYRTAVVGKWHLGLGAAPGPDWNGELTPGPLDIGFDECFLMPATGDRVPTVYVRDRRVEDLDPDDPIQVSFRGKVGDLPTGRDNPELLTTMWSHGHNQTIINGISRIGFMAGGESAWWRDETIADVFTAEANAFISRNSHRPFFLFFSLHDIHVPRIPHPRFVGATGMGPRGDCIVQVDWCVGAVMAKLTELGIAENTLVIFTSDNGPVLDDGYVDQAVESLGDHTPAGPWRGGKYGLHEGGTRVPWIVHWPARVEPGVSDALVCQVDFAASFAALIGATPEGGDHPDSVDVSAALVRADAGGREELVVQTNNRNATALRVGDWKFIPGGGGRGREQGPQLYDLANDPGEQNNLADDGEHSERLQAMRDRLVEIVGG